MAAARAVIPGSQREGQPGSRARWGSTSAQLQSPRKTQLHLLGPKSGPSLVTPKGHVWNRVLFVLLLGGGGGGGGAQALDLAQANACHLYKIPLVFAEFILHFTVLPPLKNINHFRCVQSLKQNVGLQPKA